MALPLRSASPLLLRESNKYNRYVRHDSARYFLHYLIRMIDREMKKEYNFI